jgi:hypothetical protein
MILYRPNRRLGGFFSYARNTDKAVSCSLLIPNTVTLSLNEGSAL